MSSTSARVGLAGWLLGLLLPLETAAAIIGAFEGPDEGQIAAGVGIIRGWAFSDTTGVRVTQVTLRIDETQPLAIPCCSARQDVQGAFPQYPAENTSNSGYGVTFNYGNLAAGPHTLTVDIQDSGGAQARFTHPITVVKLADSAYIDRVDLTGASATREGQEVLIAGLRVRDKASQKIAQVSARLRWFQNLQGLGLVAATTTGPAGALAPLAVPVGVSATPSQAVAEIPHAALESPNSGETGAGIAILRGWAIAPAGRAIQQVQLLVDGQPTLTVPCCSRRTDVAAAFPNEPNAANSGFGATLNYGNLTPGVHRLTVDITDSGGAKRRFTRGILTRRPGNFGFLTQLDFGSATVRIAGGELVLQGALATDKATGQTARGDLRYRWDNAAQAFLLVEESVDTVTVVNTNCDVNGDTSSLDALRQHPGADGISLVEAIQAINKRLGNGGRVAVDFGEGGQIPCSLRLVGGISINGDLDGDGLPNVKVTGSVLTSGSDITVRGLSIQNNTKAERYNEASMIAIGVSQGISASDIAFLANDVFSKFNALAVAVGAKPTLFPPLESERPAVADNQAAADETSLSRVLISGNQIKGEAPGVFQIHLSDTDPLLTKLTQISIFNNHIASVGSYGTTMQFSALPWEKATLIETIVNENTIINGIGASIDVGDYCEMCSGYEYQQASTKIITISGNNMSSNADINPFISVSGGNDELSKNNVTHVTIDENNMTFGQINMDAGSFNAVGHNTVIADIRNNSLGGIDVMGGIVSTSNIMDAQIIRNAIQSNSAAFPNISVIGGYDCVDECYGFPPFSKDNLITGNLVSNIIQSVNSDSSDISVFGAVKNNPAAALTENQVLADIISNIAQRIICEDHVPGNTAKCTCQDNTAECTKTASVVSSGQQSLSTPASTRLIQRLTGHQGRVMAREQEFREKAKQTNDPQLSIQYLEIADRFRSLNERLAARIERGW